MLPESKPIFKEAIQTLQALGLNPSQARVYLAIVRNGTCSAKEISYYSGVNRQEIYRIMPKLQTLGLAEKRINIPTKWSPLSIKNGLSLLIERKKKAISELQKKTMKINNNINDNKERKEYLNGNSQFIMLPKREGTRRWILRQISRTQSSNCVMINVKDFETLFFEAAEIYKKAVERGVIFRILLFQPTTERTFRNIDQAFKNNPNFQVRYTIGVSHVAMAVHDKKYAIINTVTNDINEGPSLISNNPVFVTLVHNYFDEVWKTTCQHIN